MSEAKELFTKDQNRLMSIAGWANALAWAALICYISLSLITVFTEMYYRNLSSSALNFGRSDTLYYLLDKGSIVIKNLINGFIYFVILRGISLGLYMVIETDMNYRQKENKNGESYEH
ncbi:MAG TPA: hypothetical protein PK078_04680 [Anaerolineales bacterium]|nr:hypothetical protein [Anaerolineales bacterium]HNA88661.1 hypothetical protein [Anaerolineales bacterium]HNB35905.1 hypothetical protein [Anaerolineales bacterium]HNC07378.1 hypothetical protein [Anaerolineales bacterium]